MYNSCKHTNYSQCNIYIHYFFSLICYLLLFFLHYVHCFCVKVEDYGKYEKDIKKYTITDNYQPIDNYRLKISV